MKGINKILIITNNFDVCLWKYIKQENPQVLLIDDLHFLIQSRASLLDGKSNYDTYNKEYNKVRNKLNNFKNDAIIFAMLYENKNARTTFKKIYFDESKYIIENLETQSVILENPTTNKIKTHLNKIIKEINKGGDS